MNLTQIAINSLPIDILFRKIKEILLKIFSNIFSDSLKLEESIALVNDVLEKAIESNDIEKAVEMLEPYSDRSLYHSAFKSILLILNAGLTLNKV